MHEFRVNSVNLVMAAIFMISLMKQQQFNDSGVESSYKTHGKVESIEVTESMMRLKCPESVN